LQKELLAGVGDWIKMAGDSVYNAKPCEIRSTGKDFVLFDGKRYWFYIHDLSVLSQANVVKGVQGVGPRSFTNVKTRFSSIKWVDNNESLDFTQNTDNGLMSVNFTGYPYGTNTVVRVAVADAL
jgi:alpha-L-fucosidase